MMNNQRVIRCILWTAVIAWIVLTLFLTLQNGPDTAATSGRIATVIHRLLGKLGITVSYTALHQSLRIAAHFIVFFVFGLLFAAALLTGKKGAVSARLPYPMTLLVCTAVSIIPEVTKQWIPGRHLQWDEALLNLLGALIGAFAIYGIRYIKKHHSKSACP